MREAVLERCFSNVRERIFFITHREHHLAPDLVLCFFFLQAERFCAQAVEALEELQHLVEERIKKAGMVANMIKFVTTTQFKQESEKAQKKFNEAMRNLQFSITVETHQGVSSFNFILDIVSLFVVSSYECAYPLTPRFQSVCYNEHHFSVAG